MSTSLTIGTAAAHPARRCARLAAPARLTAPGRLRAWIALLCLGAVALLAVTTVGITRLRDEAHAIGDQAAPQAAAASDLYFALSDLDAQVARLIMLGDGDAMSGNRLDALRTYRVRGDEADAAIAAAMRGAGDDARRRQLGAIVADLAVYREYAADAMAVQAQEVDSRPGRPPSATLGYYAEATNLMHGRLLPAATAVREASQNSLTSSYARLGDARWWATMSTIATGALLVLALVVFQVRLTRRYHRLFSPALMAATAVTAGLAMSAAVLLAGQAGRLRDADTRYFAPYLALTHAQAVSYDAAGDTSRYLIGGDSAMVRADIDTKSRCLVEGGNCAPDGDVLAGSLADLSAGPDTSTAAARSVQARWTAYERDHQRVVALADSGDVDGAVAVLTGIARGDATFDFYYYDSAVGQITAQRLTAFDTAVAATRSDLARWPAVPAVAMGTVFLLIVVGVWPRLAEYR